jgi:broad specificity phosphatase PhoE
MLAGGRHVEITPAIGITEVGQMVWLEGVELGLTLWHGAFEEEIPRLWLRWCDRTGQVIPTGAEGLQIERQRADRLAEKLRALGINPDEDL